MIDFSHTEDLFLKLYRSGVWGIPLRQDSFMDSKIDWEGILRLAKDGNRLSCRWNVRTSRIYYSTERVYDPSQLDCWYTTE